MGTLCESAEEFVLFVAVDIGESDPLTTELKLARKLAQLFTGFVVLRAVLCHKNDT